MKKMHSSIIIVLALLFATTAGAEPPYTGYSGAPGSGGRCASSCHGGSGGTIQVSAFPTTYVPGQVYTVSFSHVGGSMIKQMNASCRVGAGSQNAGVIAAGSQTATYNVAGETNGVHLTSTDLMGGSFLWTAPAAGTGEVRLYLAGHQGSYGGANTNLVLTAQEQVTDVGDGVLANAHLTYSYPNPFNAQTVIWYNVPRASPVLLEIFDATGRTLELHEFDQSAGLHQFTWNASANPSGLYFYRIQAAGSTQIRKLLLSK
jgi:hypothetical protein